MAKKLNAAGNKNAKARIKAGDINTTSPWSFSVADGNKILGDPADWKAFSSWHLAIDPDANAETKAAYGFPFGKNGKVYRSALNAIRQRAGQQGQDDIFVAAGKLRDMIDEKAKENLAEAVKSLGQIEDLIWNAIREEFSKEDDSIYAYHKDIFPTDDNLMSGDVIVHISPENKTFRVSYEIDENDNVTFGSNKVEVKLEQEWVEVKEAIHQPAIYGAVGGKEGFRDDSKGTITGIPNALIEKPEHVLKHMELMMEAEGLTSFVSLTISKAKLIEAEGEDKEGMVWEVVMIKAGMSLNDTVYPAEVLVVSAHRFEGVRALARSEEAHLRDSPRSVKDVVGWFTNTEFKGQRIIARFHFADNETADNIRKTVLDAWRQGKKDIMGFSIVAAGIATRKKRGGRLITHVESIEKVFSTDLVLNPAAGGKFLKLVASQDKSHLQEVDRMDKLLKLLESKAPGLYRKIDLENVTEEGILALLTEALQGAAENEDKEKFSAVLTEAQGMITELAEARTKAKEADEANKKAAELEATKLTEAEKKEAARDKKWDLRECSTWLREHLADTGLPKITVDRIKARFSETVFKEADLVKVIADERDYLAKLSPSGKVVGLGEGIKVGEDEAHKVTTALDGFFANKDIEEVPRFKSFKEAYILITGDTGFSGKINQAKNLGRFTEALQTSSWAEILGDSVTRRMLAEYNVSNLQSWRKIVSDITSVSDFRTNRRLRMGGYGTLPGVAEAGAYQALTSPTDEEATYAATKKGGLETITLEMIANDDVGSIRRIPGRLARAAIQTLYRAIFDPLKDNDNIYDGTALFTGGHANLSTVALSATELTARKVAMGSQTAFGDTSETLGLMPKFLLTPLELEDLGFRLTSSSSLIDATNNAGTEPNIHSTYGLEMIVVPYWTDATDFITVANPVDTPTIEVGFFQGKEDPELFVQDTPNLGSMFASDQITYKIRHIYGVVVLDYRGFQGNIGVAP